MVKLAAGLLVASACSWALANGVDIDTKAWDEAHALRRSLSTGELSPSADDPRRSVFVLARQDAPDIDGSGLRLSPETYTLLRSQLPDAVGQVSAIGEECDGFVIDVILSETPSEVRVARYVVPKERCDSGRKPSTDPGLRSGPSVREVNDVANGTLAGANAAAATSFSGTISSAADVDFYALCGAAGDAITLSVVEDGGGQSIDVKPEAFLVDRTGAEVQRAGSVWTAPYTGVYFAGVHAAGSASQPDYVLTVGVNGGTTGPASVDLRVSASTDPVPVIAGDVLVLTVVMSNAGLGTAVDAELALSVPDNTTFSSITWIAPEETWVCTVPNVGSPGKISCINNCFVPGGSATFVIRVAVDPCLENSELTTTVTALSLSAETRPEDNVTIATSEVLDRGSCDDGNFCTVDDHCAPGVGFAEPFDTIPVGTVPSAWTAKLLAGPADAHPWRASEAFSVSEPNAMFTPDVTAISDSVLDSPPIPIVLPSAQLTFMNRYQLEEGFDGGVLEISISGSPFVDILEALGGFAQGGYTGTISNNFGSPIGGRRAWTGDSNGFVPTIVNLPAWVAGRTIVLRWRMATDLFRGIKGQWIDSVSVSGRRVCWPGAQVGCDDGDACTADTCDPVAGCTHAPLLCDDGNACTDDACDPVLACVHTSITGACDDFDACTRTDSCLAGVCVGSDPVTCGAAPNACAAESCDPVNGCVATTANLDTLSFSADRVDGRDLAILARAWNTCPGDPSYRVEANLDRRNPCIDVTDFHLFMNAFGRVCPS